MIYKILIFINFDSAQQNRDYIDATDVGQPEQLDGRECVVYFAQIGKCKHLIKKLNRHIKVQARLYWLKRIK